MSWLDELVCSFWLRASIVTIGASTLIGSLTAMALP